MAGRNPKPTRLKMIQGNPGRRKLNKNEPQPIIGIPEIPEWIKAFSLAVENWNRESVVLNNMGLVSDAETGLLAMRSYIYSQLVQLAMDVKDEGRTYKVEKNDSNTGQVWYEFKNNPKAKQIDSLAREYRICGNLLGLDGSGRSKLSPIGKVADDNPWGNI